MGRAAFCVMGFYLKLRIVDGLFLYKIRIVEGVFTVLSAAFLQRGRWSSDGSRRVR